MNPYEELYQKLKKTLTDEEIAEGYMIPETLTKEEQGAADAELRRLRFELRDKQSEQDRLRIEITRLRVRIMDYLDENQYLPSFSFGQMLQAYQKVLGYRQKQLASEVAIHATKLNRLLHDNEAPNLAFLYRLEAHSKGIIPATLWWKLTVRRQGYLIEQEADLRRLEAEKVQIGW